jgi:uncharacterized protein YgiM (DUF1202 family)
VITTENIRIRRGYEGEAFTFVIGSAAPREIVTVLEIRRDIGWVRIRNARGQEGWTRLDFIRINN